MEWFLWQHVKKPTRHRAEQTANILDLVFTNEEGMVENLQYDEPVGNSDHLMITWTCNCYVNRVDTKIMKYGYDKANFTNMREMLENLDWIGMLANKSVEVQWILIRDCIRSAVDIFVPHRPVDNSKGQRRRPAWMNERVLSRIKWKKSAFDFF